MVNRGRYLDRWQRRDDRWAIVHREHVLDMQSFTKLKKGNPNEESRRDPQDPSYQFL